VINLGCESEVAEIAALLLSPIVPESTSRIFVVRLQIACQDSFDMTREATIYAERILVRYTSQLVKVDYSSRGGRDEKKN
jgi:hypothetical protein